MARSSTQRRNGADSLSRGHQTQTTSIESNGYCINYKHTPINRAYTLVAAVAEAVEVMAVPDLAVAPRRGGNGAARAGILGIQLSVERK